MLVKNRILSIFLLAACLPVAVSAQTWQAVGSTDFSGSAADYLSMAIDGNGTPYVAYQDFNAIGKATAMKFNGTSWVTVGNAGFSAGSTYYTSIAVAPNDTPYVVYEDDASGTNKATVMKFDGTHWDIVGVRNFSAGTVNYTSIAINSSGTPYVTYEDNGYSGNASVMEFNGSNWVTVGNGGFSAGASTYNIIAMGANDTPYVAYQDAGNSGKVTVMKFDGTDWVTVGTAGFSGNSATYISLAFDGSGTPYVAYDDNVGATVMKFDGTNWVTVGTADFSAAQASNTSIAINSSGTPYVAYSDAAFSNKITVMEFNGTAWVAAGNAHFTAGNAQYISLAINSSGIPYVAYADGGASFKATVMDLVPVNYYYTGSGDITSLSNWGTSTDGTGTNPTAFTTAGSTYYVANTTGLVNMPADWTVGSSTGPLNIGTGIQLGINGNTLDVTGTIGGSGTISGSSTSNLNLTGTIGTVNFTSGAQTLHNLTINTSTTATLGTALSITGGSSAGTVIVNSGATLTTGGNLTLASDANGTASIGNSAGTITGNVTVKQYIPGGRRAFRFFGHPFSTSIALSQLQSAIDITGQGGSTNGFTTTGTNNPSAFWYNPATGNGSTVNDSTGWIPFTSTSNSGNNAWKQYEGIRVLVRGSVGEGLNGGSYTPSATTLSMSGPVNQGTQTVPFTIGANSPYDLLSNPYPSATDIGTVINNAVPAIAGSAFWVWDATQQTAGAYVQQIIGSAYNLQANASFVIDAASAGSLSFAESNKTATGSALFKTTGINNYVLLHIYDSATNNSWDRLYVSLNQNASANADNYDAPKMYNSDLDFYSYSADNHRLCVDARPFTDSSIIPLGIATDVPQAYVIKTELFDIPAGASLYLHDKYLGTYTQLGMGVNYAFSVTSDAASQGDNRFELGMSGTLVVNNVANDLKINISPNPATSEVTIAYQSKTTDNKNVKILNMAGQTVVTKDLGKQQGGVTSLAINQLAAGIYMVQFSSGTEIMTQKIVKQ